MERAMDSGIAAANRTSTHDTHHGIKKKVRKVPRPPPLSQSSATSEIHGNPSRV
jgi:hypothetical protein